MPPPDLASHASIRFATTGDVTQIAAVVNSAFAIETFLAGLRTNEADIRTALRKADFLVAEDDAGRILACVRVERRGERGYFGMLAVDPARQGNGLGRALVRAAEQHCRELGCTDMDISVLSLRSELLPFYRRLGYMETGTEPFHPSRPLAHGGTCHRVVLSRKL